MKRYNNTILFLTAALIFVLSPDRVLSQELNATVTVNFDRIQDPDRNVFTTMQTALDRLVNGTRWTGEDFARNERIDCSFSLSIVEEVSSGSYKAELYVSAFRPVYNASYVTTILNHRDEKVTFDYIANQSLEMNYTGFDNNLTAIIAFWCNMILAFDFDGFSQLGGSDYYDRAQRISMEAQSIGWSDWDAFSNNDSRTSIIDCLASEAMKPYRELWYTYHRRSLDDMSTNPARGRTTLLAALPVLSDVRKVRNSETVLPMFAACKLDEIVQIAEKASDEEKKSLYDLLRVVFPGFGHKIEPLLE
jgi:hypothetical protein